MPKAQELRNFTTLSNAVYTPYPKSPRIPKQTSDKASETVEDYMSSCTG